MLKQKINMSTYNKYYLYGHLNEYFNYHRLLKVSGYNKSYKSYKLYVTLKYIGLKQVSLDNKYIFSFLTKTETIVSVFMVTIRLIIVLLQKIRCGYKEIPSNNTIMLAAGKTSFTKSVLKVLNVPNILFLKPPFVASDHEFNAEKLIYYISFKDILDSYISALEIVLYMTKKYSKRDMLFRSYSSFEFFLTCFAVEKFDTNGNSFILCEIIDRWAFLISHVKSNLIFIQHGKMSDKVRYLKIGTPDVAYYMSPEQQKVLESNIFIGTPNTSQCLNLFDFTGNEYLLNNGKKDVLLICNTLFIVSERIIISMIGNYDFNLYIKPHPLTKNTSVYKNLATKCEKVILKKGAFPKVDCVISYDSTLADEYASVGTYVIRYDKLDDITEIRKLLLEKLILQ